MTPFQLLSAALPVVLSAVLASVSLVGASVVSASLDDADASSRWLPPIETPLRVSGPYLAPPSAYASGHRGIDLPASPGDTVLAPVSGTVSFVGRVVDREVLSIRVDERTTVSFEPVDAQALGLIEGAEVSRGEAIGVVAEGGHCFAECVHLGVRVRHTYVNPMRYFFRKPVLLPW